MSDAPLRLPAPPPFELWLVSLAAAPGDGDSALLDPREQARAGRFAFERDGQRYVAAHAALRRLLGRRLAVEPQALRFAAQAFGKPVLQGDPRCAFSLSHAGDHALVALADDGEIGVDLEPLRALPDLAVLAAHCLAPRERHDLDAVPAAERGRAFLRAWTRKEACLKALGTGMHVEPSTFETGLDDALRHLRIDLAGARHELQVHSFEPLPGWVASLARVSTGPKRGMTADDAGLYSAGRGASGRRPSTLRRA